jgi:hypothetical protein
MTLRDLVQKVTFKSMFNHLYKNYYKDEGLTESEVIELTIAYGKLYKKLLKFPKSYMDIYKIYVTQPAGTNEIIHVCLYEDKKDELISFNELDVEQVIDLEIYRALKMTDSECMAYIFRQIQKSII